MPLGCCPVDGHVALRVNGRHSAACGQEQLEDVGEIVDGGQVHGGHAELVASLCYENNAACMAMTGTGSRAISMQSYANSVLPAWNHMLVALEQAGQQRQHPSVT